MAKISQSHDLIILRNALIVIFVLMLVAALYYKLCVKSGESFVTDEKTGIKIVLFWAKWCRYCEEYLSENIFMNTYEKIDHGGNIIFVQYEYEKNKLLADQLGVSSFPTIISIDKNSKLIDKFTGNRFNQQDLIDFALSSEQKVS